MGAQVQVSHLHWAMSLFASAQLPAVPPWGHRHPCPKPCLLPFQLPLLVRQTAKAILASLAATAADNAARMRSFLA